MIRRTLAVLGFLLCVLAAEQIAFAATPYATALAGFSPFACYHMNSTTSTETDYCGSNNLTYHGGCTQDSTGLTVDTGAGSYLPAGNSACYASVSAPLTSWPATSTTSITVNVWVKPTSGACPGNIGYSVNNFDNVGAGWAPVVHSDGTSCHVEFQAFNNGENIESTTGGINNGTTYMLSEVYTKSAASWSAYVDCVSAGTNTGTSQNPWSSADGPIMVGQEASTSTLSAPSGSNIFIGAISEAAYIPSALTSGNLCTLYNAGTGGGSSGPPHQLDTLGVGYRRYAPGSIEHAQNVVRLQHELWLAAL